MFGDVSFGEFGFEESVAPLPDTPGFTAFLADIEADRCWLLEITALPLAANTGSPGTFAGEVFGELGFGEAADSSTAPGLTTLRFSTHGYRSHAADTPARTWYDGRVQDGITVDRKISSRAGVGGIASVFSEISLNNGDGALDTLTANYAIDGRPARILIGYRTAALSTYGLVFSGMVANTTTALDSVKFRLSDGSAILDRPLNDNVYLGTGGNEGGADLTGKTKPKAYGVTRNVSCPLVDAANLIYQAHDGYASDVPVVYVRQVAFVKVVGAPGVGQYQITSATAAGTYFKLGSSPDGTVTADIYGDAGRTGYVVTTADTVRRIMQDAGLYDSQVDATSFSALNTDAPATVGIWAGTDAPTSKQLIEALLGDSAYGGFSRFGTFTVGQVKAAAGDPDDSFTAQDIKSIERLPLPTDLDPAVWRALVGYQKNYTVVTDVAGAVTAARRTFAAEAQRIAKHEDSAIKSRHLLATTFGPTENLYDVLADAQTEADRLFGLWGVERKLLQVVVPFRALTLDIGKVVHLQHPRFGLSTGSPGFVLSHSLRDTDVTLTVLV